MKATLLLLAISCTTGPPLQERFTQAPRPPLIEGPEFPRRQGLLRDKTTEYGLKGLSGTHFYSLDLNFDGRDDLVLLPNFYSVPKAYLNLEGKFIPHPASLFSQRASFIVFADFDQDFISDALLVTFNQGGPLLPDPPRLYQGFRTPEGLLSFKPSPQAFPPAPVATVSVLDANGDGLLDLFFGLWYDLKENPPVPRADQLYLQNPEGLSFTLAPLGLSQEDNPSPTFGSGVCDLNFDGHPEILALRSSGHENAVWSTSDGKVWKNVALGGPMASDRQGRHLKYGAGHSFYANCIDYNNDGLMDLAMGELFHSYDVETRDRSAILTGRNRSFPYSFYRTEYHQDDGTTIWDQGDRRGLWADINLDGRPDLIVDNEGFPPKSRLIFFEQLADQSFSDEAQSLGINHLNPRGTIVLDANADGAPDLLSGQSSVRAAQVKKRIYLYENQPPKGPVLLINFSSSLSGLVAQVTDHEGITHSQTFQYLNGPQSSGNQKTLFFAGKFQLLTIPLPQGQSFTLPLKGETKINLCRREGKILRSPSPCP